LRDVIATWATRSTFGAVTAQHYAGDPPDFGTYVDEPNGEHLDALFADVDGAVLLYGHHHLASDFRGVSRRYVNPGSLGCSERAVARALLVDTHTLDVRKVAPLTRSRRRSRTSTAATFQRVSSSSGHS
jgi:hypothetical protein